MDAALKERWTAALRSGKYQQGSERLRDGNLYCCLGVLCEIDPAAERVDGGYFIDGVLYEVDLARYGVGAGRYGIAEHQQTRLIQMNDDDECDFYEIADYIDDNVREQP